MTLNSSSTTWRISGTSCWVLNWKGTCVLVESFLQSAHKKLEGSRQVVLPIKSDILRLTALVKGDRKPDLEADWHQSDGIVLKVCKIEFAQKVFHLLKKPGCWSPFLWSLVGCELRRAVLKLWLSLEGLVFLLLAARKFASSVVIRDISVIYFSCFLNNFIIKAHSFKASW